MGEYIVNILRFGSAEMSAQQAENAILASQAIVAGKSFPDHPAPDFTGICIALNLDLCARHIEFQEFLYMLFDSHFSTPKLTISEAS